MHTESSHQDNREPQHSATPSGPTDRRALLAGIGGLAAGAFLAGAKTAHAGPLNPPPGPITPTGKTLTEVEPRIAVNSVNTPGSSTALFRITQRGSYYLTGNITGVAGRHGIEIAASGVTLDLNGFDLVGISGMGNFDGIRTSVNALANIAILNGSVRSWGGDGVNLRSFGSSNCRVEGLVATSNTGNGIRVGSLFVIAHCTANSNGLDGMNTGSIGTITNCLAPFNTNFGIFTSTGVKIFNCSARFNGGSGIAADSTSTIANCSASSNSGSGIATGSGCTIDNCSAAFNTLDGIAAFTGSTISNCTSVSNVGNGILASEGSSVTACTARLNRTDGIECTSSCVIRENNCSNNGNGADGAGIHVTGSDNRIEGNNCIRADRGIDVDGTGNIIIRNTCSGNAVNYAIAANNRYGPIIGIPASGTAAVNGNSASGTLTSADPHANFAY